MTDAVVNILLLEDEPAHAEAIRRALEASDLKTRVHVAGTLREYHEAVAARPPDIALLDLVLPDGRALDVLTSLPDACPFPILIMTSYGNEQTAVEAMKAGALDYIVKSPEAFATMPHAVERALREWNVLQERKRAEAALRESEERFRTLYENSTLGLYRTTPDGRIVLANPALVKMLGYSSFDDLSGRDLKTEGFEPTYPRAQFVEMVEKEDSVVGLESAWKRRDGTTVFVRESARAIRDPEGRIMHFDGTVEDITGRKEAEVELAYEQSLLRALMDNATDQVYFKDVNSRFIRISKAQAERFGLSDPVQAVSKTDLDFFAEEHARQAFLDEQEIMKTGRPLVDQEEKETWPDGRAAWVSTTKVLLRDKQGQIIGTFGISRDITERKRAEEALRESEKKYRLLIETANESIVVAQDGLLKYVNPVTLSLLGGYSERELVDRPFPEFVHPDDRSMVVENYRQRNANEAALPRYAFRVVTRDGTVKWVEINAALIEWQGKPATLNFLTDITERKRADTERETALLRQEGINRLKQSLLAPVPLEQKLKSITDSIVQLFDADFCRIWLIRPGDLCEQGCIHAEVREGPHLCRLRDRCLHLLSSSGRYTHIDGKGHGRVPFGCYKIGRVASDEDHKFFTNDVQNDPRVHDHGWARELGLVSFVGYQLRVPGGQTMGVLALFAKRPITPAEEATLDGLSGTVALVVQQAEGEEALRKSEERFRFIFDNAIDGMLLISLENQRIESANSSMARMLGYSLEELKKLGSTDIHPKDKLPFVKEQIEIQSNDRLAPAKDLPMRRKDGSVFYANVRGAQIILSGKKYMMGVFRDITERKRAEEHLNETLQRLRLAVTSTIQVLGLTVEARDPYTAGHQQRTTSLAEAIAREMGLPLEKIEGLHMAGRVHDVGKISIPAEILSKPTKLTPGEYALVKTHAQRGYEILKDVEFPWPLAEIVYEHHERMDGSGYPRGLKGDEILMEARILSVSDTVEAMVSDRPYRPAQGVDTALAEVEKNKGILYDADVAETCLKLFRKKRFSFPA